MPRSLYDWTVSAGDRAYLVLSGLAARSSSTACTPSFSLLFLLLPPSKSARPALIPLSACLASRSSAILWTMLL